MSVYTPEEIATLKKGGSILATALTAVAQAVQPGVTTAELNTIAEQHIRDAGGEPAFLGYHGFPAALCTSKNERVVHGIPSDKEKLREGDIIGLDLGVRYQSLYTDMATTVPVGNISPEVQHLLTVTKTALQKAIAFLRPGITTGDLGAHVQAYVEGEGLGVVRDLVGHGVGHAIHEEPAVPNFGNPGKGGTLEEGMVLALEPMVTMGDWHVRTLDDHWTVQTLDGSLSAHFEHTVVITQHGSAILTQPHEENTRT